MPSDEENAQFLYLVLTAGGPPAIDWPKVSEELDLSKGATTKRWSRLKQAMEKGANPGPTAYQLLWLCMKHSPRDKAPDWNDIAAKCNTTPGAASKRYSRMKVAFDSGTAGDAPTPAPKAKKGSGDEDKASAPAKRKRGAGAAKSKTATGADGEVGDGEDVKVKSEGEDEEKEKPKPKRARASKKTNAKVKKEEPADTKDADVKPKQSLLAELEDAIDNAQAMREKEDAGGVDDTFYDAAEQGEEAQKQERVENWLEAQEI